MPWVRGVAGAILILLGLIWIGQGLNVLRGAAMSGHAIYAILGLVAVLAGAGLLWSLARVGSQAKLCDMPLEGHHRNMNSGARKAVSMLRAGDGSPLR